eukprot:c8459_g1_i1.p1 GENE.c8459_g1_i1~~c8459_g1_i1.p1  ORF type:complete len:294 (+),score=80.97 c8459_g1_i1:102-983(+)
MTTKRIVVFGGNGFVGSAICREAVKRGLTVQSVSRSGSAPPLLSAEKDSWIKKVEWLKGDVLDPTTYNQYLQSASAVVLTIGSPPLPFVDYNFQLRMNGHTATTLSAACKQSSIPRFVAVSATMPSVTPRGYFDGKLLLEQAAKEYPDLQQQSDQGSSAEQSFLVRFGSVVLRPAAIYGSKVVQLPQSVGKYVPSMFAQQQQEVQQDQQQQQSFMSLPLWAVMQPFAYAMKLAKGPIEKVKENVPALRGLVEIPVDVRQVAIAAVDGCVDDKYSGNCTIISNAELVEIPVASC